MLGELTRSNTIKTDVKWFCGSFMYKSHRNSVRKSLISDFSKSEEACRNEMAARKFEYVRSLIDDVTARCKEMYKSQREGNSFSQHLCIYDRHTIRMFNLSNCKFVLYANVWQFHKQLFKITTENLWYWSLKSRSNLFRLFVVDVVKVEN